MYKNLMQNKIVLFAKQPGKTSFSSLFTIKKALGTNKVGHTGTLDSFAEGLLVVCTGNLTRLAGRITDFDKKYSAVISFGEETDTLECTGRTVKTAPLPKKEAVVQAVENFSKTYLQVPPVFSAIHVGGKRASEQAREGKDVEIPSRKVTVFSSNIKDYLFSDEGLVKAILVDFYVSKGTYIRALARDIGNFCGSAAHLSALVRTKVGNFSLEDAAGFSLLEDFTIENALKLSERLKNQETFSLNEKEELHLKNEVIEKSVPMTPTLSKMCGFGFLRLTDEGKDSFLHGKKLSSKMFLSSPLDERGNSFLVFTDKDEFVGVLQKESGGFLKYGFVVHKND